MGPGMACRGAPETRRAARSLAADVLACLAHDRDCLLERFIDQSEAVAHRLLDLVELFERVGVDLTHDAIAPVVRVLENLLTLEPRLVQMPSCETKYSARLRAASRIRAASSCDSAMIVCRSRMTRWACLISFGTAIRS